MANQDKIRAKVKEYQTSNVDKVKASQKEYREKNAEIVKAKKAQYAKENSARLVAKAAQWAKDNPERRKEQMAEYRVKHKLEIKEYDAKRFQRRMETDPESVRKQRRDYAKTPKGRAIYYSAQNLRRRGVPYTDEAIAWIASIDWSTELCTYCSAPATEIDHILPITKGGDGSRENLTPCCRSCNASKGNRYLADFLGFVEPERMLTYA